MTLAGGVKGPATELSQGLIDALVRIPITSTTQNRRLLISLVRRDFSRFPDVQELPESRLHLINIVVACLEHPAALWALRDALTTMAPDDAGTRRACQLIDSAGLGSLVSEDELRQCRELMRQADNGQGEVDWQGLVENIAPHVLSRSQDLVSAFDQLAVIGPGQGRSLPALTFVAGVTASAADPVAGQLRMWLQEQIERFGVSADELLWPSDAPPGAAGPVRRGGRSVRHGQRCGSWPSNNGYSRRIGQVGYCRRANTRRASGRFGRQHGFRRPNAASSQEAAPCMGRCPAAQSQLYR